MIEPVLGWRIWKVRGERLASWAVDYCWEPGENRAVCLAPGRRACAAPPGRRCQCGFWALWSPQQSLARAAGTFEPPWQVMGVIAGWGTVALHDREGFRAECAAVRCLFTDGLRAAQHWTAPAWLVGWWRRRTAPAGEPDPAVRPEQDSRRSDALRLVAARYGVPLVSLEGAVSHGLLGELGIPPEQIEEARSMGIASSAGS